MSIVASSALVVSAFEIFLPLLSSSTRSLWGSWRSVVHVEEPIKEQCALSEELVQSGPNHVQKFSSDECDVNGRILTWRAGRDGCMRQRVDLVVCSSGHNVQQMCSRR